MAQNNFPAERNAYLWPFAQNSIWNTPIGSDARMVPAGIKQASQAGMTFDEDILVFTPDEPLLDVWYNPAGWDASKNRCEPDTSLAIHKTPFVSIPYPRGFEVSASTWDGSTPNSGIAVLLNDRETIWQGQPFAYCNPGSNDATILVDFGYVDLYGDGRKGAHGGSALSAIGGTVRLGELQPGSVIRHVLKVNLYAAENLYYDNDTKGYRWPAFTADNYAADIYGGTFRPLRMGSLLALPESVHDTLTLETEPARILARAFRDYGAYVVDDTYWDVYAIETEWGPQGRVVDEFEDTWGFPFHESSKNTPWSRDMDQIFTNLHVVDNNSIDSLGGGGSPRVPLAPPFMDNPPLPGEGSSSTRERSPMQNLHTKPFTQSITLTNGSPIQLLQEIQQSLAQITDQPVMQLSIYNIHGTEIISIDLQQSASDEVLLKYIAKLEKAGIGVYFIRYGLRM